MSLICELILIGLSTMAVLALCYIAWLLATGLRCRASIPQGMIDHYKASLNIQQEQIAIMHAQFALMKNAYSAEPESN